MNVAQTRAVLERPAALKVALATIAPLAVVILTPETLLFGTQYGIDGHFVLLGSCVVLLGSAAWLNQVMFRGRKTVLPFVAAIFSILSVWTWQKLAFDALIPSSRLTYGYFLTPEGAHARFWVLNCPFWVGVTCLSICFIAALVLGWRVGARGLLACMVPWWLAGFVVFALPSLLYLDGQGNASIFI